MSKRYRATLEFEADGDAHAWILARQLAEQPQGRIVHAALVNVQEELVLWSDVDDSKDDKTEPIPLDEIPF